jgi:predicted transcriptional regulator
VSEADLSESDKKVFDYMLGKDFEANPWSTPDAAQALGLDEKTVYEALSNLSKHMKGRFYIYYKDGALRIQAE